MLIPREHGAYGQILFPVVCALLIGRPATSAYLLAVAGLAAFLAHEPLLVLLGQRGVRAARDQRSDAWRSLALFGGIATAAGVAALFGMTRESVRALAVPLAFTAAVGVAVAAGRERSTTGEILVALALASFSLPVALAGGVPREAALTLFIVFATVFVTATVSVRALIGRTARSGGPPPAVAVLLASGAVAVLSALSMFGALSEGAPFAAMPVCSVALGLSMRPPELKHLRTIGWTLVAATALTAIMLVASLS